MGMIMEFYCGAAPLDEAMRRLDYCRMSELSRRSADFSLHLSPDDLELLVECAGKYAHADLPDLESFLSECAGDDESGSFLVGPELVRAVAAIHPEDAAALTADWGKAVEIEPNNDMLQAVTDLLALCRSANEEQLPVYHYWSL